jgi:hypothetical protein
MNRSTSFNVYKQFLESFGHHPTQEEFKFNGDYQCVVAVERHCSEALQNWTRS